MDYRKILVAYIDHVGYSEGTDFLPAELRGLTAEENAALAQAAIDAGNSSTGHVGELTDYLTKISPTETPFMARTKQR
jgi:hypothetical protein